ncbi:hypothetical protein [Streptomyces sp. NPDC001415]
MDPITLAAATAVVGAMATDAWQQTRASVVEWWRRVRPDQADSVDAALSEARTQVLAARQSEDVDREAALVTEWQNRLRLLLREDPSLGRELQRLVDEEIAPSLPDEEQARAGSLSMKATASGHGRVYQAGHDQHITER